MAGKLRISSARYVRDRASKSKLLPPSPPNWQKTAAGGQAPPGYLVFLQNGLNLSADALIGFLQKRCSH